MALGNLTPQIGQGLNADQLRYIKLALDGANVIYNLDAPASAYPAGVPIMQEGHVLDGQRDQRFTEFKKWAENRGAYELSTGVNSGTDPKRLDGFLRKLGFKCTGGNYTMVMGGK